MYSYFIVKSKPDARGGHFLGVYKGARWDAVDAFDGDNEVTDVSDLVEAAIKTLAAHPDEAMYDIAGTIELPQAGFLDHYDMSAILMQQSLQDYAEFAKDHPIFEEEEDLFFRDFVDEHVIRGRHFQDVDRDRIEWICRTICGRLGAPDELNTWFPPGWEEAA